MFDNHSLEGLTILLVAERENERNQMCLFLRAQACEVLEAKNGNQAMELCKKYGKSIDLILSDINMPELASDDFFLRVKSFAPFSKFIFTSGEDKFSEKLIQERQEMVFILKPHSPGHLIGVLCEILGKDLRRLIEAEHPHADFSFFRPLTSVGRKKTSSLAKQNRCQLNLL